MGGTLYKAGYKGFFGTLANMKAR